MKTLKAMMMGLALTLALGVANAAPKTHHDPTKDEVVDTYTNALVHGDLNGVDNAIDDNAQFYVIQGVRVNTSRKNQVLDYLKTNANIEQQADCSGTVLQDNDAKYVKKVEIKYNGVTRTDVVTAQLSDDGWKITKVETSFK